MYWKRLFKPHILDRGYGYYQEKMIKVQKLVYDADEKMIRDYMTSILMNDDKLLTRFSIMLQEDINGDNINMYISQIDDIACRYLGLDGFIDYYRAGDFISELEDIYDNDVRYIISKGKYMKAFNIINYIFMLIGDIDMDDSDGGIGILADKTYEIWLELLHKVNDKDKQNMYEWFITHLNGVIIDYLEDYIERILIEEFKEQEYLEPKLIMIESKLKELVVDVENPSWNKEYMIGKWVTRYIDLLENYQYKLENIEKLY